MRAGDLLFCCVESDSGWRKGLDWEHVAEHGAVESLCATTLFAAVVRLLQRRHCGAHEAEGFLLLLPLLEPLFANAFGPVWPWTRGRNEDSSVFAKDPTAETRHLGDAPLDILDRLTCFLGHIGCEDCFGSFRRYHVYFRFVRQCSPESAPVQVRTRRLALPLPATAWESRSGKLHAPHREHGHPAHPRSWMVAIRCVCPRFRRRSWRDSHQYPSRRLGSRVDRVIGPHPRMMLPFERGSPRGPGPGEHRFRSSSFCPDCTSCRTPSTP